MKLTEIDFVELSLTVPIVNTMAFLFTVLGEWYVENKVISRGKIPSRFRDFLIVLDGKP